MTGLRVFVPLACRLLTEQDLRAADAFFFAPENEWPGGHAGYAEMVQNPAVVGVYQGALKSGDGVCR